MERMEAASGTEALRDPAKRSQQFFQFATITRSASQDAHFSWIMHSALLQRFDITFLLTLIQQLDAWSFFFFAVLYRAPFEMNPTVATFFSFPKITQW